MKNIIDFKYSEPLNINGVEIRRLQYIKYDEQKCSTGNFYNKDNGECLGKICYKMIYYLDENNQLLSTPLEIKNIEWRPE